MLVRLWDHVGTGLIIKAKTGIVWTNQVGGVACLQPECEGVFVPFGNDTTLDDRLISLENELHRWFRGSAGLSLADGFANGLGQALEAYGRARWLPFQAISIDPDRLADSVEAWIHVDYRPGHEAQVPLFEGLGSGPWKAVLTWTNSS